MDSFPVKRVARCLLWFLVGVALAACAELSFADSFNAYKAVVSDKTGASFTAYGATALDACTSGYSMVFAKLDYPMAAGKSVTTSGGACFYWATASWNIGFGVVSSSCPPNSTKNSDGTCACGSGYTYQGGQCVTQDDCSKLKGTDATFNYKGVFSPTSHPKSNCHNGCNINYWGFSSTPGGSGYSAGYAGTGTYDGTKCTAAPDGGNAATDAERDCAKAGKGFMTINGKTVCTDATTTSQDTKKNNNTTKTDSSGNTSTIPGGSTSKNTTCDGDNCTTTETTTNPDGSTSTKTDQQDKKSFCEENPSSFVCKNSSASGSADCNAPPECDGEAVMCAQLKQNWELYCAMNKQTDETRAYQDAAAGTDPSSAEYLRDHPNEVNIGSSLDSSGFLGGSCPNDITISLPMGSATIPLSQICQPMMWIGNVIMAVAFIIGGAIMMGPIKGGA